MRVVGVFVEVFSAVEGRKKGEREIWNKGPPPDMNQESCGSWLLLQAFNFTVTGSSYLKSEFYLQFCPSWERMSRVEGQQIEVKPLMRQIYENAL